MLISNFETKLFKNLRAPYIRSASPLYHRVAESERVYYRLDHNDRTNKRCRRKVCGERAAIPLPRCHRHQRAQVPHAEKKV